MILSSLTELKLRSAGHIFIYFYTLMSSTATQPFTGAYMYIDESRDIETMTFPACLENKTIIELLTLSMTQLSIPF